MPFWQRVGNVVAGRKDPATGRRTGGMAGVLRNAFTDADGDFAMPQQALVSRVIRKGEEAAANRRINRDNREADRRRNDMIAAESRGRQLPPVLGRPSYGIPTSLRPSVEETGPPSSMQNLWQPLPNYSGGRTEMTDAERQQQREQFDRYKDDPNSIYYQGGSARDPMPSGPASRHRSPVRETYERSQAMTRSGEGFNAAREHYRNLMQINRNSQD